MKLLQHSCLGAVPMFPQSWNRPTQGTNTGPLYNPHTGRCTDKPGQGVVWSILCWARTLLQQQPQQQQQGRSPILRWMRKGCFGPDTLVTTSSGNQKLMKDMKIGEEVLSDETGRLTKFIGWMELSRDTKTKMIEIETDDGEKLIMTGTHNVFYYKEDKPTPTYVKNLRPGNVLVGESGKVQQIHAFIEK